MSKKRESLTFSGTPEIKHALEQIAFEYGCLWGNKPNVSKLLEHIAIGEIRLEPPIKDRLLQIRIAKLEAETSSLKKGKTS